MKLKDDGAGQQFPEWTIVIFPIMGSASKIKDTKIMLPWTEQKKER